MSFSFRGIVSHIDLRRLASSDHSFTGLRRRMIDDLGMDATRADRLLDDMLARAMTRFGDDFVLGKSQLLDDVVNLRERLDGLYHQILNFDRRSSTHSTTRIDPTGRTSIADQLRAIDDLYHQLDDALEQLGKPLHEVHPSSSSVRSLAERTAREIDDIINAADTAGRLSRRPGHDHRDIDLDISQGRLSRRSFKPVAGSGGTSFIRTFADGSTATFTMVGGRYRVHTKDASGLETTFHEYDLLQTPYGRRPLTTSLMQAHHGLQNSLMTNIFEQFGYDGGAAPTIWLRNSRRGSPHGAITATQNSLGSSRRTALQTLSEIRRVAIEDLALTDMPHDMINAYILAFDRYFERAVLPQMSTADRTRDLGTWQPPSGAAP
jgi:hypothetical protein